MAAVFITAALLLWPVASFADEALVDADTYTDQNAATQNFGAATTIKIAPTATKVKRGLVRFDLSTLPAGATAGNIDEALIVLFAGTLTTDGNLDVCRVTSAWTEGGVTNNTFPSFDTCTTLSLTVAADKNQFVVIDAKTLVQGWLTTPASNNGIALISAGVALEFDAKEDTGTSHHPRLLVTLTSAGPTGATGPSGPAGATGPSGPSGPEGATGPSGPSGPQGTSGPSGPQGATGTTGPSGPSGPQGETGATGPSGPQGATGPSGPQGDTGVTGPSGPSGPQGDTGATGPSGPSGPEGINWQGEFVEDNPYNQNDAVHYTTDGSSYICVNPSGCTSTTPASNLDWNFLAEGGDTGATGPSGPSGPQGATGATGPSGPGGTQGVTGPSGPSGPQGDTGATGPSGPQGNTGTTGATGATGPSGPNGTSQQIIGGGSDANIGAGKFMPMFGDKLLGSAAEAGSVVAATGTVNNFRVVAASSTTTGTFVIYKNGVAEAGTTCTMTSGGVCGPITSAVSFTAGDRIAVGVLGTPTAVANGSKAHWGATFSQP